MDTQQPMKMAAAEALYNTTKGASFSLVRRRPVRAPPAEARPDIRIPHLLSLIATLSWNGTVKGINQVNAAEQRKYGPGDYIPIVGVTYWSFRLMIGAGVLMLAARADRRRVDAARPARARTLVPPARRLGGRRCRSSRTGRGWIFTEMGRQPWVVYGLLKTSQARSPNVSMASIVITLAGYIVVYGVLSAVGGAALRARGPARPGGGRRHPHPPAWRSPARRRAIWRWPTDARS